MKRLFLFSFFLIILSSLFASTPKISISNPIKYANVDEEFTLSLILENQGDPLLRSFEGYLDVCVEGDVKIRVINARQWEDPNTYKSIYKRGETIWHVGDGAKQSAYQMIAKYPLISLKAKSWAANSQKIATIGIKPKSEGQIRILYRATFRKIDDHADVTSVTDPLDGAGEIDQQGHYCKVHMIEAVKRSDVDIRIPKSVNKNENAIGLVIGNKNYTSQDIPNVDFAHKDSRLVKKYLERALGFNENNIIYFENASSANFREIFGTENNHRGKLSTYVRPEESELFIYYTGHGAPDINTKTAYIVPVDCNPNFISLNGYSLDLLYENIDKLNAKSVIIVIDACFSGGSAGGPLIENASPVGISIENPALKVKNSIIFNSSSGTQISSWYPEKQHGLFTYYFLKGLQGNADSNKDGKISANELQNFVSDQSDGVPLMSYRLFGREQVPVIMGNASTIIRQKVK